MRPTQRRSRSCDLLGLPAPAVALHCRADARLTLGDRRGHGGLTSGRSRLHGPKALAASARRSRSTTRCPIFALEGPRAACRAMTEAMEFDRTHGLDAYVDELPRRSRRLSARCGGLGQRDRRSCRSAGTRRRQVTTCPTLSPSGLCWRSCSPSAAKEPQARPLLPRMTDDGRESIGYLRVLPCYAAALVCVRTGRAEESVALLAECLESPSGASQRSSSSSPPP